MSTLLRELAGGIPDMDHLVRAVIRIVISSVLGAVIGIQREHTGKPAGLRTHMLVSMGATLFVLVPVEMGFPIGEVGRVIQGVATGIGFIGGGAILKLSAEREVRGLTTAAGIWMTAAAGVAVGLGYIAVAALGIGAAWLILSVVGRAERHVEAKPKSYER
ncbi:MAG TPA: MgtC/SapB family protein [Candidatus Eisenbacteria bacterium]|jgi:putative Mg2+ transporter-C (MgtC) family protein|nr:MgtC/SapB family protein [Candidatus Eisenbacteria bacterium]